MIEKMSSSERIRWLPEGHDSPRLIVGEQTGRWALALQRHFSDSSPRIYQTRSVAATWEMLANWPTSFVVVELTRLNAEALLDRIVRRERDYPLAQVAVAADRELAGCEWLFREAGAAHYVTTLRNLGPLAQVARRHLAQVPRPRRTFTEEVWAGLPWGERIAGA